MNFSEYLENVRHINDAASDPAGLVLTIVKRFGYGDSYREASLVFADLGILRDEFERLWGLFEEYEDLRSYMNRKEPMSLSAVSSRSLHPALRVLLAKNRLEFLLWMRESVPAATETDMDELREIVADVVEGRRKVSAVGTYITMLKQRNKRGEATTEQ